MQLALVFSVLPPIPSPPYFPQFPRSKPKKLLDFSREQLEFSSCYFSEFAPLSVPVRSPLASIPAGGDWAHAHLLAAAAHNEGVRVRCTLPAPVPVGSIGQCAALSGSLVTAGARACFAGHLPSQQRVGQALHRQGSDGRDHGVGSAAALVRERSGNEERERAPARTQLLYLTLG